MWEALLTQLLFQLLEKAGPMLIEIIIKWLQGLNDEERKVALDGLVRAFSSRTA